MSSLRARTPYFPALLLGLFVSTGCLLERMDYVDHAAETACKEARRCDNLGPDGFHPTYDECLMEERGTFDNLWPAEDCDEGRINRERFDSCMDRVELVACDGGLFDWLAALEHCAASKVCID